MRPDARRFVIAEVQEGGCDFSEEMTLQELHSWQRRHKIDLKFSPAGMSPGHYGGYGCGIIFCVLDRGNVT